MPVVKKQRVAPKVAVVDYGSFDERNEILNQFASDCVGPNSAFSAFFDDPDIPAEYYERRGYEAVMSPKGEQITHKGDRLWKRPREAYLKEVNANSNRAMELASAAKSPGEESYASGQLQEIAD